MIAALTSAGSSGCYASSTTECTPADTTYSCCLKKNRQKPEVCSGLEGSEVATFQTATIPTATQGAASGAKQAAAIAMAAITATAIAALVQGDDDEALDELQDELDRLMTECAEHAEQTINRRILRGRRLTTEQCNEEVGKDEDGKPVTRAMVLGTEKHAEALACVKEKLGKLIPGYFLLEQRYRYDRDRRRVNPMSQEEIKRLIKEGRKAELRGTLEPDLVIHSGDPTQARFVYDFKFPCKQGTPATWRIYPREHPYRDSTQGEMYREAFGVPPARVVPEQGVIR
jgi:hypothetical protein